jgi:hypothetical protein
MPAPAPQDPPLLGPAVAQPPQAPLPPAADAGVTADTGAGNAFRSRMDRDFIAKNQIVERYFANKLPARGAMDFERYCRENPELLDELRVATRVQAGLRLMEAGGMPLPWEERPKQLWERLPLAIGVATLALVLAVTSTVLYFKLDGARKQIAALTVAVHDRPTKPITTTRSVSILPGRNAPSATPSLVISSSAAEFVELKLKMEWAGFVQYRVTVDRIGQGRVMILNNVVRDSNGQLRIAINSAAFGPGNYQFAIDGLTLGGEARPQAWFTLGVS